MIGLKKGTVKLLDHQKEWVIEVKTETSRVEDMK